MARAQRQQPPSKTTQVPSPSTGRMFRLLASIPRIAASSTVGPSGGIELQPALPRMGSPPVRAESGGNRSSFSTVMFSALQPL